MKNIFKIIPLVSLLVVQIGLNAQEKEPKVILISIDGLRWQELFGGADQNLISNDEFIEDVDDLEETFQASNSDERREKLMPFLWNTIAENGVIYGNRNKASKVELTNGMRFSYPGYNEILSGFADDENINSNDKIYNNNVTILEKLENSEEFKGKVKAFGSWDVFPYIINDKRTTLPVNAGYSHSLSQHPTENEKFLDKIQDETPKRWGSVRFDVFTHNYAIESIKNEHPRVVYIAYGETDDYAHDGRYDHYLYSTKNTDQMISEIWNYVQSDPFYKDQTTLIITTDHGRGTAATDGKQSWKHHGKDFDNSEYTWLAMIGNEIPALGEAKTEDVIYTNQIANTVAYLLNFKTSDERMGESILPIH